MHTWELKLKKKQSESKNLKFLLLTLEFSLSRINCIVLIVIDSTIPSSRIRLERQSTGMNINR